MNKKRYHVTPFFEVAECPKCNIGALTERVGGLQYLTDPPKADFKCRKCGEITRLTEPGFPTVRYQIDFNQEVMIED